MSSNASNPSLEASSNRRFKPPNSTDPGWDYGQPVSGNVQHIKCDFCNHISKGGIKRFKQHLVKASYKGLKYKDVAKCDKVSLEVVDLLRAYMEDKQKITEEKKKIKEDMVRGVNVYGDEDDIEDIERQRVPKKMKGPMDSFVAPIDVDFVPRAPTNKENKKALENIHCYIADFFYDNGISFNCAKSDSYMKMMQAIVQYNDPLTFKPPSYNDLRVNILKKKKEETEKWIEDFKVHWETYGVTIMTDWWTDGKGRTLINFLVNCPKGTIFLKSIDGSSEVHDATLIHKMLKEVIAEVGEKNVIQVCTDNASNYKLAGKWLMEGSKIYWMPCSAHCVNLILGDVSKLKIVSEVVKEAQKISLFIYNHKHVLHLMRKATEGRELIRPSVTRFATSFLCLQSMHEKRQKLRDMIHTADWRNSKWPKHPVAKEVVKTIKSNSFWNNMHVALIMMGPLVDVIRMVDMEEKPSMAYIYSAMDQCKAKIKNNLEHTQRDEDRELWKKVERIIDNRWADLLQKPLHAAAHYLNPQYYYASLSSSDEMESNSVIKEGLLQCIEKLALDEDDESQILRDLIAYRTRVGRLGKRNAQACITTIAPVEWWITFGSEVPALQRFAKRVLGLTSAASPCERNWSLFSNLHTKKRNCLDHERLQTLAYIQYNRRLKKRFEERISGKEIDPIVLKSLDECVEWLVPNNARDDIVLGMDDLTYGMLEDAEDGADDPPVTRQSRTSTPGATSSSRPPTRLRDEPSSDEDDFDDDGAYDVGDNDEDDGIDTGSDEDL